MTRLPFVVSQADRKALQELLAQRTAQVRLAERARLVLLSSRGLSDRAIAREVGCCRALPAKWRKRFQTRRQDDPGACVEALLDDAERTGRPPQLRDEVWVDVLALATSEPSSHGLPITHWTSQELASVAVSRGSAPHLSPSYVRAFLAECQLQPHKVKEWMNRPKDPEFEARARRVKELTAQASAAGPSQHVVVSFDEKTGMQARERVAASQPMKPGQVQRLEFEYRRHGTLVLFAFFVLSTGAILGRFGPTRTNADTAAVLLQELSLFAAGGARRIDVVLDQLNTHWSEDLVKVVAKVCGLQVPDQVLKKGKTRRAWLEDPGKKVVFHFTPKHASWLNPVEIWFGILVRKVLRRGSFLSTQDLQKRVAAFIRYYNEHLAHPFELRYWREAA